MINVVLRKGADYSDFETALINAGYNYRKHFKRIFVIECDKASFILAQHKDIESIENPVEMIPAATESNINVHGTPDYPVSSVNLRSWGKHRLVRRRNPFLKHVKTRPIDYDLEFSCVRTGLGVDVYILDSDYSSGHQEFSGGRLINMSTGETEFSHTYLPDDTFKHGQAVAACIGGNALGIAPNCGMYFHPTVVAVGSTDSQYLSVIEDAYDHYMSRAVTNRPAVLNISYSSWGSQTSQSPSVVAAFDAMIEDGFIICVAAGNYRQDADTSNLHLSPAEAHTDFVVVGATDAYDQPMFFKRYDAVGDSFNGERGTTVGSAVDIYAPGRLVPYPYPQTVDGYSYISGTSFASPYVAGVIACMLEGYQRLTSKTQVQNVIAKLIENSTKDAIKDMGAFYPGSVIHNRLAYLDPYIAIEPINGLIPL